MTSCSYDERRRYCSSNEPHSHWKLFVDGASRRNPGPSGAGIYLLCDSEPVGRYGFFIGVKTNNEAEYFALLLGLHILDDHYHTGDSVRIISDSQLLVRQVCGEYRVKKPELQPLHARAVGLLRHFGASVSHVMRTENTVADTMANHGIDKKVPVPPRFAELLQRDGIPF